MNTNRAFHFVVNKLEFLRRVPLLPHLFDSWLRIWIFLSNPQLADCLDEIETEVSGWKGIKIQNHKYGGTEFSFNHKEIGHIHSNGLMDVLLNKTIKMQLLQEGRISNHHVFPNSGWISFYVKTKDDSEYALGLLKKSYAIRFERLSEE